MKAGPTSAMMTARNRVAHVVKLIPDICSLDVASMNCGEWNMFNSPAILREMAANGEIADPKPLFQLCLGSS